MGKIAAASSAGKAAAAPKEKKQSGPMSAVMKALKVIDIPRAAVVSGVREIADIADGGQNTHGFIKGIQKHEGVGDMVAGSNMNPWLKRAIGFAGDVALDPLTYLTGGASAAVKGGSHGVVRALIETGSKELGEKAARDAAEKVLARGISSLSKEELASIGTKGGLVFKVPFSSKTSGVVVPNEISSVVGRAVTSVTSPIKQSKVADALTKSIGGSNADLKNAIRKGSVNDFIALTNAKAGKAAGRVAEREFAGRVQEILKPLSKSDKRVFFRAMNGDPDAVAAAVPGSAVGDAIPKAQAWFEEVRVRADLPHIDDYFPRRWSKELKDFLGKNVNSGTRGGKIPAQLHRELVAGEKFMGEVLEGANPAEVMDHIQRIANDKLGDGAKQVFSDDVVDIMTAYARDAARRVGRRKTEELLTDPNSPWRLFEQTVDEAAQAKLRKGAVKASERGAAATARATEASAQAAAVRAGGPLPGVIPAAPTPPPLAAVVGGPSPEAAAPPAPVFDLVNRPEDIFKMRQIAVTGPDGQGLLDPRDLNWAWENRFSKITNPLRTYTRSGVQSERYAALSRATAEMAANPEYQAAVQRALASLPDEFPVFRSSGNSEIGDIANVALTPDSARQFGPDVQVYMVNKADVLGVGDVGDMELLIPSGSLRTYGEAAPSPAAAVDDVVDPAVRAADIQTSIADLQLARQAAAAERKVPAGMRTAVKAEGRAGVSAEKTRAALNKEATQVKTAMRMNKIPPHQGIAQLERIQADLLALEGQTFDHAAVALRGAEEAAAENIELVARIDAQLVTAKGAKRELLAQAKVERLAADRMERQAQAAVARAEAAEARAVTRAEKEAVRDATRREVAVARLEAQAARARASANQNYSKAMGKALSAHNLPPDQYRSLLMDSLSDLKGTMSPGEVADAITRVARVTSPDGWGGFLKVYDGLTRAFKTYSILSPGFHVRNYMGGVFNNHLAGVPLSTHIKFIRLSSAAKKGTLKGAEKELWDKIVATGQLNMGEMAYEVGRNLGQGKDNVLIDNPLTRGSHRVGSGVENVLRGSLALHVLDGNGTINDAIAMVDRFHFDYSDMSSFEANVMRRVVPFYTWTRKNFPLQIEEMVRQPGKYNKYLTVKRNLELGTEEEDVVPSYFHDLMGIRTPWKIGGATQYLTPDLPFVGLAKTLSPGTLMSSINPIVKAPLEVKGGKQFFSGVPFKGRYQEAPAAWEKIPGLLPGLQALGKVKKNASGQYVMRDTDAYLVEQYMPLLARARRLAPSEPKMQERATSTWLGFMGVPLRANTPSAQAGEKFRQAKAQGKKNQDEKDLAS